MNKAIFIMIIAATLSGCGKSRPLPSGRLEQPNGGFSYVTPEGWFRNKVPGIDFIIVHAKADYGMEPNIFVDFVNPSPDLEAAASRLNVMYRENRDYTVVRQSAFITEAGMEGIRTVARRKTRKALPLVSYHYLMAGPDRVVSITCTCAEAVAATYEPIFNQAMSTLQLEAYGPQE